MIHSKFNILIHTQILTAYEITNGKHTSTTMSNIDTNAEAKANNTEKTVSIL